MDVLREREVKDSLERQLLDEQKIRAMVQKRLRRERRARRRVQEQLELEVKRRVQMEEALKASGAAEQLRIINETLAQSEPKTNSQKVTTSSAAVGNSSIPAERERLPERVDRMERERAESPAAAYGQQTVREPPPPPENKPWAYSGIDLMNTGAAFWQNYSESLAQELELERKSRQQQVERDVKSPLQDRSAYYKNSVLFTSTAT